MLKSSYASLIVMGDERGETMQTERFMVQNVKCASCSGSIRKGLGKLPGVTFVRVEIVNGEVVVQGEVLSRPQLALTLKSLGYPESSAIRK